MIRSIKPNAADRAAATEFAQMTSYIFSALKPFASLEKLSACWVTIKILFIISPWDDCVTDFCRTCNHPILPQQEPGPAQCAWEGVLPQQAVSFGPGISLAFRPDRELVVDISRFVRALPQPGQVKESLLLIASTSLFLPHERHTIS
jgi:hypothetical protein